TNFARPDRPATAFAGQPLIFMNTHHFEPGRHPHGVAIRAASGEHGAAGYRIPRRISPLNRSFGHTSLNQKTSSLLNNNLVGAAGSVASHTAQNHHEDGSP